MAGAQSFWVRGSLIFYLARVLHRALAEGGRASWVWASLSPCLLEAVSGGRLPPPAAIFLPSVSGTDRLELQLDIRLS